MLPYARSSVAASVRIVFMAFDGVSFGFRDNGWSGTFHKDTARRPTGNVRRRYRTIKVCKLYRLAAYFIEYFGDSSAAGGVAELERRSAAGASSLRCGFSGKRSVVTCRLSGGMRRRCFGLFYPLHDVVHDGRIEDRSPRCLCLRSARGRVDVVYPIVVAVVVAFRGSRGRCSSRSCGRA